jgi:hypothetical protein
MSGDDFQSNEPVNFDTPSNSLPACPQFARIAEFDLERPLDCAVCDRLEISHPTFGVRLLSVADAERERASLILRVSRS